MNAATIPQTAQTALDRAGNAHARRTGDSCALMSLMIACFDHVMDERPPGRGELLGSVTRSRLVEALDAQRPPGEGPVFPSEHVEDRLAGFVIEVTEELFKHCRALSANGANPEAWSRFHTLVLEAYDAQLQTRSAGPGRHGVALEAVRRKNTRTTAMTAAAVLLAPNLRAEVDPVKVIRPNGGARRSVRFGRRPGRPRR